MALNRIIADSIADGTVVASDIADGTITLAKLQSGLLPPATANSAAAYANAAFATANTGTASGSYANSAFATANTGSASGSYANSAFSVANTSSTNATNAGVYANSAFATANTGSASGSYANSAFAKANTAGTGTVTSVATGNGLTGGTITTTGTLSLDYYTGSDANYTSYPVGSYLISSGMGTETSVARNNSSSLRYTQFSVFSPNSGTLISGTWRARGAVGEGACGRIGNLWQRTA
jgi:hypothetical protein